MSHPCPECGQSCNCCGDVDDCEMDTLDSYVSCCHCVGLDDSDDDYCREDIELAEIEKEAK